MTAMQALVYANEGLVVIPQSFSVAALGPDQPTEQILTVTPYAEGTLRFSVLVRGQIDGQSQAGQLTVPVQVGETRTGLDPMGTLSTDASGEPVISLPAREH